MKAWKEFMEFTNLKGQVKNFVMLLMLTSFLYCSVYTILANFMYWNGNTLLFYGILYVLVIVSAYVYMLVLYQFLKKKRDDDLRVDMKACRIPLIMTQSVFFLLMAGGSFVSYLLMENQDLVFLQYLLTPILLLLLMLYIPWQVFAILEILNGKKHPLRILKDALLIILRHYQSVFYSLLALGAIAAIYYSCMDAMFEISISLVPATAVIDIMTRANPFLQLFTLMASVLDNVNIAIPAILSLLYGIIMCIALSFYYMVLICIFDDVIHV